MAKKPTKTKQATKSKPSAAPKAKPAAKPKAAKKAARKPNAAFMAALKPSEALAAIIGSKPLPRTEIVKSLWAYIRKQGLQDKTNKRMINTDEKFKAIAGGAKQISMFDLAKLIGKQVSKG